MFPFTFISGNDGAFGCATCHCEDHGPQSVGSFWVGQASPLFLPCIVCASAPATVVEIPCGHVLVCSKCFVAYQNNAKCLRCHGVTEERVHLEQLLLATEDPLREVGAPPKCASCQNGYAEYLALPCEHLTVCQSCFTDSGGTCPVCDSVVDQSLLVQWRDGRIY